MILFIDDDRAYWNWVTRHRDGFVLEGHRGPRWDRITLHRANCPLVKNATSPSRKRWTTGAWCTACALDLTELSNFVSVVLDRKSTMCSECCPGVARPESNSDAPHLSRLASLVLDYVLDAAVICIDRAAREYQLTVADVATCMGKSIGQIRPVLSRLSRDQWVELAGPASYDRQVVRPTAKALKTLAYYRDSAADMLDADLASLRRSAR